MWISHYLPRAEHVDNLIGTPVLAIFAAVRIGHLIQELSSHMQIALLQSDLEGNLDIAINSIASLPSGWRARALLVDDMS